MSDADRVIRWGILGTAGIAHRNFLPALRRVPGTEATGIGSRSPERAARFAAAEGVVRAYGSYEALLADPAIDAVYVALPNHLHRPWTIRALEAGKAVFCEKPLGLDAAEVEEMVEVSRRTGQPLWEAFVFPFQEQFARIRRELPRVGRIRRIDASFSFALRDDPENVRWVPEWGGGALYDVGCYPVHLTRLLLGAEPMSVEGRLRRGATGVDVAADAFLHFPDGVVATVHCGFEGPQDTACRILGEAGCLWVESPYHQRAAETLVLRHGDVAEHIVLSADVPSFTPALAHIAAVLRGREEPRHLAAADAVGTAATLERLRALPEA
jgi:predicted dehydrogenase